MSDTRSFPALGGAAAWRVVLLFGPPTAVAAAVGEWEAAAALAALGFALDAMDRAVVFEVSPLALVRAVIIAGVHAAPARAIAWDTVDEITTRWRRPRDYTGLETVVTSRSGDRITFGSRMGLRPYCALLTEVVQRAPHARHTDLTDQLLRERTPALR